MLAVVAALSLPALVLVKWQHAAHVGWDSVPAIALPEQVGPWTAGQEDRLDAASLAIIEPDAYLLREYRAPGRATIWIYMGLYMGRGGYQKGAHDPEVCYPAHGWEVVASERLGVPLDGNETLHTTQLRVQHEQLEETAVYWFQPSRRWPASAAAEELLRIGDALAGRTEYGFVRLSARNGLERGVDLERDLAEFASAIARPVRVAVDGARAGGVDDSEQASYAALGSRIQ